MTKKMLTHSKIPKFAFIGTSCSGKTTATYNTCGYLKLHGIRTDGILQQDRRLPFPASLLPTHAEAQYWFITNLMTVESYMSLQKGTDCIVSDRSVLDFFAYAKTQWPSEVKDLESFVFAWMASYTRCFYLRPRVYDNDGVRPDDEFRLSVDKTLNDLITAVNLRCYLMGFESGNLIRTISSWEEAARSIAVTTRLGMLQTKNAFLTGSWSKGLEKVGSDFDCVLLVDDWTKTIKGRFDEEGVVYKFRGLRTVDRLRSKHDDPGLVDVVFLPDYNMEIQLQSKKTFLKRKQIEDDEVKAALTLTSSYSSTLPNMQHGIYAPSRDADAPQET
jgi:hypothetical protein